jgi:hypothetical protein
MAGKKPGHSNTQVSPHQSQDNRPDVFLTLLRTAGKNDKDALARFLQQESMEPGRAQPDAKGAGASFHVFATDAQIEKMRAAGWQPEVKENLSETGRLRQREVALGDRFKGGRMPPLGLGKKI